MNELVNIRGSIIVELEWETFKSTLTAKSIIELIQYIEDNEKYTIFSVDGPVVYVLYVWKGAVPMGGDQTVNDAAKLDFETNYKSSANKSLHKKPGRGTFTKIAQSTDSVLLLASNISRLGATIYNNPSGGSSHRLRLLLSDSTVIATPLDFGVIVEKDGYYEVPFDYDGPIFGIWDQAGTGFANVTEFKI